MMRNEAGQSTVDSQDVGVSSLRSMLVIRGFEQRMQPLFTEGLVRGSTHLANGQEAVAVGAVAALDPTDPLFCTYRGHHHCLARGMPPEEAFAEILGRRTGCCRGKGGSMHLTDVSRGLYGSYAIVGAHIPIAVGSAWASHILQDGKVTCCFFGDGTTTIGAFHEALNLAATWKLPVIFVCENNLYSEYSPISTVVPVTHPAADRASAYGLSRIIVDGNDVSAVRDAVALARNLALQGGGPSLIEAKTYRQGGHSRADPGKYRPEEEVQHWMGRDPIDSLRANLDLSAADYGALCESVDQELDAALNSAKQAPEPELDELMTDVWEFQK